MWTICLAPPWPSEIAVIDTAACPLLTESAGKLYDPNVDVTLERVFRVAGQFSNARVAIVGHTDASRKGQVPFEDVRALSLARAEAVKQALLEKFPGRFDPNKFVVDGKGWLEPADPAQPGAAGVMRREVLDLHIKAVRELVDLYGGIEE